MVEISKAFTRYASSVALMVGLGVSTGCSLTPEATATLRDIARTAHDVQCDLGKQNRYQDCRVRHYRR